MRTFIAFGLVFFILTSFKLDDKRKDCHAIIFVENITEYKIDSGQIDPPYAIKNRTVIPHCSKISYQSSINTDSLKLKGFFLDKYFYKKNKRKINRGNALLVMKYTGFKIDNGDNILIEMLDDKGGNPIKSLLEKTNYLYEIDNSQNKQELKFGNKTISHVTTLTFEYKIINPDLKLTVRETHKIFFLKNIERQGYFESHCL